MENSSTLLSSTESLNYYAANITDESSSILLHRLHTNERQLRTLAVVLSLTGGLALSFALGVGILIYWYSRKCKQKRRLYTKNNQQDDQDDDEKSYYSYCASCDLQDHHESTSQTNREQQEQNEIMLLPPPPIALLLPTPEPSAPSAKELVNQNMSSSSTEELCHDCLIPPPAYTENQSCITPYF